MKRPATNFPATRTGHIRTDLSQAQLAGIGAVAVAYNEVEILLDVMLGVALGIRDSDVRTGLTSRINGADGKVELVKSVAENLGAPVVLKTLLAECLGKSGFGDLKIYRDAIIHARVLDSDLRSEEHTSELQSRQYLVCRLLLEKKKTI